MNPARKNLTQKECLYAIAFGVSIWVVIFLCGCASTVKVTEPSGTVTDFRVGFGNRFVREPYILEPSPYVVDRAYAFGLAASEQTMNRIIDSATSVSR